MKLITNKLQIPAPLQILQFVFNPISWMEACAQRYGDIFMVKLNQPEVWVSNPEALKQILANDNQDFRLLKNGNMVFEPILGRHSVITVSGDEHHHQRQLLMTKLHGNRMRTYGQVMSQVTEEVISQWLVSKPFCIQSQIQSITLKVIMQAVLGSHKGKQAEELETSLVLMLDHIRSSPYKVLQLYFPFLQKDLGAWSPWGKFIRCKAKVDRLLYAEIEENLKKSDESRTDILSLLIAAKDKNGESMTCEELRDELITLLIVGHETTATAIVWALYWIHKIPRVKEKLLLEINSLGKFFKPSNVLQLPYLNAVCNETLRIYPLRMLTFPRVVENRISLCGYELEPGTVVTGCIYLVHQREDLYTNHWQFNPERFLEKQYSPYEFIPFGGGERLCIGMAFAQFEMKVVLATILANCQLDLVSNTNILPQRDGLVTGPNCLIEMVMKRRLQSESNFLAKI